MTISQISINHNRFYNFAKNSTFKTHRNITFFENFSFESTSSIIVENIVIFDNKFAKIDDFAFDVMNQKFANIKNQIFDEFLNFEFFNYSLNSECREFFLFVSLNCLQLFSI